MYGNKLNSFYTISYLCEMEKEREFYSLERATLSRERSIPKAKVLGGMKRVILFFQLSILRSTYRTVRIFSRVLYGYALPYVELGSAYSTVPTYSRTLLGLTARAHRPQRDDLYHRSPNSTLAHAQHAP